jgi:hypothetical protein
MMPAVPSFARSLLHVTARAALGGVILAAAAVFICVAVPLLLLVGASFVVGSAAVGEEL